MIQSQGFFFEINLAAECQDLLNQVLAPHRSTIDLFDVIVKRTLLR